MWVEVEGGKGALDSDDILHRQPSVLCVKNFGYLKGVLWLNKSAILQREETKCITSCFHDEKLLRTSGGAVG